MARSRLGLIVLLYLTFCTLIKADAEADAEADPEADPAGCCSRPTNFVKGIRISDEVFVLSF